MTNISIETKFPPFKGKSDLRLKILGATTKTGQLAISLLRKTTETWEHNVTFSMKRKTGGGTSIAQGGGVARVDITTSDLIWHALDEGTNVRYVGVSGDWEPKTVPGVFDSFPGAGEVFHDGVPRPGIHPRNWSEALPGIIAADFADNVFEAMVGWP